MSTRVYWFLSSFACRQRSEEGVARPQTHSPSPLLRHHRVAPSHAQVYATTHTGTRHSQHLPSTPHVGTRHDREGPRVYVYRSRHRTPHSASLVSLWDHPVTTSPLSQPKKNTPRTETGVRMSVNRHSHTVGIHAVGPSAIRSSKPPSCCQSSNGVHASGATPPVSRPSTNPVLALE